MAVCTEPKSSVVELKVDTWDSLHTGVNSKFHPRSGTIPLLYSLECSPRYIVQATTMGVVKLKPLTRRDRPLEGGALGWVMEQNPATFFRLAWRHRMDPRPLRPCETVNG